MKEDKVLSQAEAQEDSSIDRCPAKRAEGKKKKEWKKPTLEDVSEKIMAQPYIRFT